MEFNKNYLNHNFIKYNVSNVYGCDDVICTKCGIIVWYYSPPPNIYKSYNIIILYEIGGLLTLTCEEVIIKNIIE